LAVFSSRVVGPGVIAVLVNQHGGFWRHFRSLFSDDCRQTNRRCHAWQ